MSKKKVEDTPTAEECMQHHIRNAVDRYRELVKMVEDMLSARSIDNPPSFTEVMAQREHQESGPICHAITNLIERISVGHDALLYLLRKDGSEEAKKLERKIISTQHVPESHVES